MREILPNQLWIGNAGDGRDPERLLAAGVVAVVNLAAEEPSPKLPRSMIYCHFPLTDGEPDDLRVLDVAIQTVVALLKKQIPTLVYCGAGMSRSPAIVAAAFFIVQGGSPDDKLKEIAYPVDRELGVRRSGTAVSFAWHHSEEGWLESAEKIEAVARGSGGHCDLVQPQREMWSS